MMQTVITFIVRMFEAAFYTLIFMSALGVAAFIVWAAEEREKEKRNDK